MNEHEEFKVETGENEVELILSYLFASNFFQYLRNTYPHFLRISEEEKRNVRVLFMIACNLFGDLQGEVGQDHASDQLQSADHLDPYLRGTQDQWKALLQRMLLLLVNRATVDVVHQKNSDFDAEQSTYRGLHALELRILHEDRHP